MDSVESASSHSLANIEERIKTHQLGGADRGSSV